ncbi:hypothetical protein BCR33DRAFT_129521 [Rhizoclosmatium globosum]|uniref:Uncharacterized protein n=1 Tax=Rhizoclosmatium globosum TaxID=329046 RepID=A0A1Y2CHU9_9FUNG|nr:hypothetical protein BCR33DRAFT_129521 [Rhizoclosmatium globosum]|eukprot:ORY46487.1 hypothetical protein BCR33DRAFT_129521 [Rhizoclosmatium globosum]
MEAVVCLNKTMSETCDGLPFSTSDGAASFLRVARAVFARRFCSTWRVGSRTRRTRTPRTCSSFAESARLSCRFSNQRNKQRVHSSSTFELNPVSHQCITLPHTTRCDHSLPRCLFHRKPPPSCILIDDLSTFFHPAHDSSDQIRFTLALLQQSVNTIAKL